MSEQRRGLSAAQIESFRSRGYLIVPNVFTPAEVDDLGDFHERSGGLKVVPGSHRPKVGGLRGVARHLLGPAVKLISAPMARANHWCAQWWRGLNVPSRKGDVVVWSFRTLHSGNAARLKRWPSLSVPTWMEQRLPHEWTAPGGEDRTAMFLTFAGPGACLDRYIEHRRKSDAAAWRESRWDRALEEQARAKGVALLKPSDDYGAAFSRVS